MDSNLSFVQRFSSFYQLEVVLFLSARGCPPFRRSYFIPCGLTGLGKLRILYPVGSLGWVSYDLIPCGLTGLGETVQGYHFITFRMKIQTIHV